jgi:hypothetical protein
MKKIEKIIAESIQMLEDGSADIESLTAQYPEHKEELARILETFSTLKKADLPKLSTSEKENASKRLMNLLTDKDKIVTESKVFRPNRQNKQIFKQRRNAMSWIVIASLIIASLAGGTGTALAAQDSLPGDGLYGVKTLLQDIQLTLSGDEGDIDLLLQFMDENLRDMEQLAGEGRYEDVGLALHHYEDNFSELIRTRDRIHVEDPASGDLVQEQIQTRLQEQTQTMLKLQLQVPTDEQLQTKLQETIRTAENGMEYGPGEGGEPAGPGGDPLMQNGGEDSNGNGDDQEPGNPDGGNGSGGSDSGNGSGGEDKGQSGSGNGN